MKFTVTILSLLLIVLTCAAETPQVEMEYTTDMSGNTLTRCVTPGQAGPLADPVTTPSNPTDQEVLWTVEHATAIGHNVAIAGDGGYMTTGWYLNYERTSLYEVQGTGTPLWEYSSSPNFYIPVACSDDNSVIASTGDIIPLCVWLNGTGPNPTWQYSPPANYKGVDCDVSDNGQYVVSAYQETSGSMGKLLVFAATDPTILWETDFDATNGINGVEISDDNNWILITSYYAINVFDFASQVLYWTGSNYSQTMGGMDDDAEYVCCGDFSGYLDVYQRTATGYDQIWSDYLGGWVTACDISSDASTVIAGNFTYSPANAGEVRGYDIAGNQLFSYDQYGDYIADVALCDNGTVGVASSWGALDYTFGDVFTAFDMGTGDVIFQLLDDIDEPGTIFDVAISHDGMYAVCGGKAVHARTFGNGGQIYSIELGSTPSFTIDVTYVAGSPVPAGGGNIDYEIYCENLGSEPLDFDGWLDISYEGGDPTTLAQRYFEGFQPGWTINRPNMYLPVPSTYAAGNYLFMARAGDHPNTIWAEDGFSFVKSGTDAVPGFTPWTPDGMPNPFDAVAMTALPDETTLSGAYPNPFNPTTVIGYQLQDAGFVNLSVYDVQGREVAELVRGWRDAGLHDVTFDASHLTSGIYFYRLTAGDVSSVGKMVLVK